MTPAEGEGGTDRLRVDLWIWRARLTKTRMLAQELIAAGRVRVNRDKVRAAGRRVGPGDVITIAGPRAVRVLRVVACPDRRGSAGDTVGLYEDLTRPAADDLASADPGLADD